MSDYTIDEELDATGLNCPMPLLKAKQVLNRMHSGSVLRVLATDAGSIRDFQSYTQQSDHELLEMFIENEPFIYIIKRG